MKWRENHIASYGFVPWNGSLIWRVRANEGSRIEAATRIEHSQPVTAWVKGRKGRKQRYAWELPTIRSGDTHTATMVDGTEVLVNAGGIVAA